MYIRCSETGAQRFVGGFVCERGATLTEYILITSIFFFLVAGAILYAEDTAIERVNIGKCTYQKFQMDDPENPPVDDCLPAGDDDGGG